MANTKRLAVATPDADTRVAAPIVTTSESQITVVLRPCDRTPVTASCTGVWSVDTACPALPSSWERTCVSDARPWAPAPVELPPLLPLRTRAQLDEYITAVTLLVRLDVSPAEAMRLADEAARHLNG